MIGAIISAILKAILGFFQDRREADANRNHLETLARDAERNRVEAETARKNLEDAQTRNTIDTTVRDLSNDAALERLRASVRPAPRPEA